MRKKYQSAHIKTGRNETGGMGSGGKREIGAGRVGERQRI